MSDSIQLIIHSGKNTLSRHQITAGAGKSGKAIVIEATDKVRYELLDEITGSAPHQILLVRKGKDLHILLNAQGNVEERQQPADLIIQNYYEHGKSQLIGLAED